MLDKKIKKKDAESKFQIQKIYIKSVSFKSPHSPYIFKEKWNPKISCDLNTVCNNLENDLFNVILQVFIEVKIELKTIFQCKIHQAGIFYICGMSKEKLTHCLGAYCPTILFPYARESVSNLTIKAGFPQLNLEPINFDLAFSKANLQKKSE
ncbi:protein-export chaperone SecB [Buchnera aphidicola]|uniref:protein-export chaperone SecB n=1 Tax=Buchnera aphidicola TaxID=9 RepID=UPI0020920D19|nr:protein-export chaperone SecB [Buchnera aphidicola]USS94172.1 protein-export chaperone SecB [Buchnera aphidicola (Sipha maydis)]WII23720.1 protein-export chaperone SecB [Buchnera aphidicola (Sipha maydis)]